MWENPTAHKDLIGHKNLWLTNFPPLLMWQLFYSIFFQTCKNILPKLQRFTPLLHSPTSSVFLSVSLFLSLLHYYSLIIIHFHMN
ncbi:hypothetical protein RIF29_35496 [Crotalaria pallida]|uniref:Uncharacterized protein n=1 Tax=Crotalaria pallida TaxID=3830 RepID=A0AAN9EFX9_CROPI